MNIAVLLTAAGAGTRLGFDMPKALVPLHGEPILARALASVREAEKLCGAFELITTAPPAFLDEFTSVADPFGSKVVAGGESRQASVAAGLAALPDHVTHVLVHDAARPLTPPHIFKRVVSSLRHGRDAVVPGLLVADTIKRVGYGEKVAETVNREDLRAIQTPQGFERGLLERVHAASEEALTDDAGLVEAFGGEVWVVPGDAMSLKITTAFDLKVAESLLA